MFSVEQLNPKLPKYKRFEFEQLYLNVSRFFPLQMDQLEIHVRSHYTDRPYVCVKCDKSYKDSIALGAHMAVHSGKRSVTISIILSRKEFNIKSGLGII